MATGRQNNIYRIHSSENLSATTTSGATRSSGCPAQITKARISSSALAYVLCRGGQGEDPTATVANGIQVNVGEPVFVTVVEGDEVAAITASGTATVNIAWLDG
tara:strand:+ start:5236 stop:5547 length:312 start_codon:yes stop_codon:yes gene_type:complete